MTFVCARVYLFDNKTNNVVISLIRIVYIDDFRSLYDVLIHLKIIEYCVQPSLLLIACDNVDT